MSFNGLRILALESRRAEEIATLIRKQGGAPFVAPSMREIPLESNDEAFLFGDRLLGGEFDCVIFLTGVGTKLLWKTLLTRWDEAALKAAMTRITLVVRGPKPSAALRELGVPPHVIVPEPNTWRETLQTMAARPETRVVVQEYGKSNPDLLDGLRAQGRQVSTVRIYGWDLPEDTAPLREAARRIAAGEADALLLTTATQLVHLMAVAEQDGIAAGVREGLGRIFLGSIGPTTSEALEDLGLKASFEPSHPKMGLLVNEAAQLVPFKR